MLDSGGPKGEGGPLRQLEPSELLSGGWSMEMGKKCWIPTVTANNCCLMCFGKRMWRLLIGNQCDMTRAQDRNAQRWIRGRMSFRKGYRRGAPCLGDRFEGCSKFPLLPHTLSLRAYLPSPTPSWDTSPAVTATEIWQSGNPLLPFPPPFWASLGHTPRPGPARCKLGSKDHSETGLAPPTHPMSYAPCQSQVKSVLGVEMFACPSHSFCCHCCPKRFSIAVLAVGMLSSSGILRCLSRSQ